MRIWNQMYIVHEYSIVSMESEIIASLQIQAKEDPGSCRTKSEMNMYWTLYNV